MAKRNNIYYNYDPASDYDAWEKRAASWQTANGLWGR